MKYIMTEEHRKNLRKEKRAQYIQEHPIGSEIGRFKVIGYEWAQNSRYGGKLLWCFKLQCTCGNVKLVPPSSLFGRKNHSMKQCAQCAQKIRTAAATRVTRINSFEAGFTRVFNSIYQRSLRMNVEFNLDKELAKRLMQSDCHYCGCRPYPVEYRNGLGRFNPTRFCYMGIDRVDSKRGYIDDNVVPCCKQCNIAKNAFTVTAFLAWARRLAEHQGWCQSRADSGESSPNTSDTQLQH